jgi:hypothetical protein
MISDRTFLICVCVSFLFAGTADADRKRIQLIRELDVSALVHERPGEPSHGHSVSQLKMSDDDQWIAVDLVAGHFDSMMDDQHHHLLLIPADPKTGTAEQFDYDYLP